MDEFEYGYAPDMQSQTASRPDCAAEPYWRTYPWMVDSTGLALKGSQLAAFALLFEATVAPGADTDRISWDYVCRAMGTSDPSEVMLTVMKLVQAKLVRPRLSMSGDFKDQYEIDLDQVHARDYFAH